MLAQPARNIEGGRARQLGIKNDDVGRRNAQVGGEGFDAFEAGHLVPSIFLERAPQDAAEGRIGGQHGDAKTARNHQKRPLCLG
ncbi:MAG: hypothetical protein IPK28_20565 [Devosia sp.]|nr:hypothetical protein [Devosia sp.]